MHFCKNPSNIKNIGTVKIQIARSCKLFLWEGTTRVLLLCIIELLGKLFFSKIIT